MNNKNSHLKRLQRTTPDRLSAQTFTQCIRTLCLPPTTILVMWLFNKISFANVGGRHTNNRIFNQNEPQDISFEKVAKDNTK